MTLRFATRDYSIEVVGPVNLHGCKLTEMPRGPIIYLVLVAWPHLEDTPIYVALSYQLLYR